MFDYNYIKTSDTEAVISRLTWPVWKLVTGRSDRAEWAIAEKPEDPVRFAEQVFLAAKEKGDTLKSVTIVECDNNYIESMVKNGKVVNRESAVEWAKMVYDTDPDYADTLFSYNGANIVTRAAILVINVGLTKDITEKFLAPMDNKTYKCLCDWAERIFNASCYIPNYLMSADTLLGQYGDIITEEHMAYNDGVTPKRRILNVKHGRSVVTIPIFVPERFDSATFEYDTLFGDEELVTDSVRDPWAVPLEKVEDVRITGITECIANLFGCVGIAKPVKRFEKIDNLAYRAGMPGNGFYDAIKGEMERIYATNSRGAVAYLEL